MVYKKIKRRVKKVFKRKKKKKVSKKLYTSKPKTSSISQKSSFSFTRPSGSYNPSTKTYTSPSGAKQSRAFSNVPRGTRIVLGGRGGGSSGGSRGGSSSRPTTSSAGVVLPTIDTFTPKVTTRTKSRGFDIKKYAQQKRGQDIRRTLKEQRGSRLQQFERKLEQMDERRARLRGERIKNGFTFAEGPRVGKNWREKGMIGIDKAGLTVISSVGQTGLGVVSLVKVMPQLPKVGAKAVTTIFKDPASVKRVSKAGLKSFKQGTKNFIRLAQVSPTEAIAKVGSEIFLLGAVGRATKVIGKLSSKTATKLNVKYKKFDGKQITLRKEASETFTRKGKEVSLKKRVPKPKTIVGKSIQKVTKRKPGQFKKFQKRGLSFKAGTVKSTQQTLAQQVAVAGTKLNVIGSAQANRLFAGLGKEGKEMVIRKPLPSEEKLRISTKRLLERFDEGKLKNKDIRRLNNLIRKETGKSLLERSTFFAPGDIMRISRFGIKPEKTASLREIMRGKGTLKGDDKPEFYFQEDVAIPKLPKSLGDIKKKMEQNKPLTQSQEDRFVTWTSSKPGQYKPVGDTVYKKGIESEVTIPPKTLLKKVKTEMVTLIQGKKVKFIRTKPLKPTKETNRLLNKHNSGTATRKEIKILTQRLSKETGFKIPAPKLKRPRIRKRKVIKKVKKKGVVKGKMSGKRGRPPQKIPIRAGRRITGAGLSRIRRRPQRRRNGARPSGRPRPGPGPRPGPKPGPKPGPRPTPRPTPRPPVKPPIIPPFKKKKKKKGKVGRKKKARSYNVYARPLKARKKGKRPRLIQVNRVALTKRRAKDLRNYVVDTSLSRTGRIKVTKGKARKPLLNVPSGYSSGTKIKFRKYRTVKGRKVKLRRGKVIERRRRLLDTRQEKRKITLRRRIKQISPKRKIKKVRRTNKRMKRRKK